jgi:hypothetical protein
MERQRHRTVAAGPIVTARLGVTQDRRGARYRAQAAPRSGWMAPAAALVLVTVLAASCGASGSSASTSGRAGPSSTPLRPHALPPLTQAQLTQVLPSTTSSNIAAPDDPDLVALDPSVQPNGELFVFLPGTGGQPGCCQLLLEEAATAGFAAIGLTYPNSTSVASRCGNDATCFGPARQNILDGSQPGPGGSIAPDNAVEYRLASLLAYLAGRQPDRWGRFLKGSSVDWSRVVIAGHSQGGGEAAYIGGVEHTEGVAMLAAPVDSTNGSQPQAATYLTAGHLTPLSRYVGFDHTADPFERKISSNWAVLGLGGFGPLISVDHREAPYGGSHQLTTSVAVPQVVRVLGAHDSSAVDVQTPMCPDGVPRFVPVWRYMMEVAGGLPLVSSPNPC